MTAPKRPSRAGKREVIEPHKGDKRYAHRVPKGSPEGGQFGDQVSIGKSLARDNNNRQAKPTTKGHGDQGDTKKSPKKRG